MGRLLLAGDLPLELELPDRGGTRRRRGRRRAAAGSRELERYFAGEPVAFDLDVDAYAAAHGLTAFERDVYRGAGARALRAAP